MLLGVLVHGGADLPRRCKEMHPSLENSARRGRRNKGSGQPFQPKLGRVRTEEFTHAHYNDAWDDESQRPCCFVALDSVTAASVRRSRAFHAGAASDSALETAVKSNKSNFLDYET